MVFGPNGNCAPLPFPLKIDGVEIERIGYRFPTKSFKLVGVHLDDSLNWNEHANHVRSKLAKTNYGLARAKRCLPPHIKKLVYNSLFRCHLEYCLPIWGDCSSSFSRGFLSMQKQLLGILPQLNTTLTLTHCSGSLRFLNTGIFFPALWVLSCLT